MERVKKTTKKADLFVEAVQAASTDEEKAQLAEAENFRLATEEAKKIDAIAETYYKDIGLMETMKKNLINRVERFIRKFGHKLRHLLTQVAWNNGGMITDNDDLQTLWNTTFKDFEGNPLPVPKKRVDDMSRMKERLSKKGFPESSWLKPKEGYISKPKDKKPEETTPDD